jgi:hypothetical protein
VTIGRQAVIAVPDEYEPPHDMEPSQYANFTTQLTAVVAASATQELGLPVTIAAATWFVTCQPRQVDDIPYLDDCPNGPGCYTCEEGRRAAKMYLATHPGKHLVIGLVSLDLAVQTSDN